MISLIRAEPPAVSRKETCRGLPSEFLPSQEPERDLSWSKDFWAAVWESAKVAVSNSKSGRTMRSAFMASDLLLFLWMVLVRADWFLWRIRIRQSFSGWSGSCSRKCGTDRAWSRRRGGVRD